MTRWALVPVVPTNSIQIAGLVALDESDASPPSIGHQIGYKAVRESYEAMIAVSPGNALLSEILAARDLAIHPCTSANYVTWSNARERAITQLIFTLAKLGPAS